ncbi:MAG: ferritin [Caldilineaceae bacterium]|nr:ferritin [Caldilineaceae bacterium]
MIIKPNVAEALNTQTTNEFTNMFAYLVISAYFDDQGLPELAAFFLRQSEDERLHAMKIFDFLLETGAKPTLTGTPPVQNDFVNAEAAVQYALDQELKTTGQINDLVSIALAADDHTTHNFLQWFVTEQVEEVDTMTRLLQTVRHAQGNLLRVEDYVLRNMPAIVGAEAGV